MYLRNFLSNRIVFSILFLMLLQTASAASDKVTEKLLKNGMKVIVKEDHRAPVVVSQIWYKVGSSYESDGTTGVSHVLEHMMFKGTSQHPDDTFNKIIAANGGEDNAFTSRDYTAYYQTLEKSRLDVSFKLESDRMRNLILRSEDFAQEIKVVQEERRWRTEDKPKALVYEQLYVTAFDNSGYHHPVIGWMGDLQNMNVEDLKKWYQTYYSPNNAILVVVGDVNTTEVLQMAENYFADIKPSKKIPFKQRKERIQRSSKLVKVMVPAKVAYLTIGFKVPVINTASLAWEPYALALLAGVLDGGDSTRLNRNLIKGKEIAVSAGADYTAGERMDTLFELNAIPASGKTIQALQQAVMDELQALKDNPVSLAELDRIKNQIIASAVFQKDSIFYQAMKIGQAETTGVGWKVEEAYVDNIKEITPEQIQQVAQKYLVPQRKTVAILEPQTTHIR
ncbi:MAG: pitrilysin family protein [Pseudomonadota bacterium]